jgi:hypothetical protein
MQEVMRWASGFGEGLAMLAAAGSPDVHPNNAYRTERREIWDREMLKLETNLKSVEEFFLAVLDEKLVEPEEIQEKAFSFFGYQGAWYTVGWQMGATIERAFGRPRLVECMCNPIALLKTYNEAVARVDPTLPKWSPGFLDRLWE